jgi:hypothetical protein
VVLEEMGILFNNVNVMRFMWDAVHNCPEGCITVFYWDKELQDLIKFEFVCQEGEKRLICVKEIKIFLPISKSQPQDEDGQERCHT